MCAYGIWQPLLQESPADESSTEGSRFVESPVQPGVFLLVSLDNVWKGLLPTGGAGLHASTSARGGSMLVEAISGFDNPASVVRSGDLLYIGNTSNNDAKLVTVVDIAIPGTEFVVDEIDTPLNPVGLAVAHERLYVIDQDRNPLSYRPLAGGEWTDVVLPNAAITEWSYGDIIYPLDHRILVIHYVGKPDRHGRFRQRLRRVDH